MRMTSAPSWARCRPQDGAAMNEAASTTRKPASASGIVGRGDKRRERAAEKLAVVAARQGRNEENLPRPLVGSEPRRGVVEDARRIDPASLAPHDEGRDDIDVGVHADLG